MNLIEVNNISKKFESSLILNQINFKVESGDFIVLEGETGSGKTTLINLILGLSEVDSGKIRIFNCHPKESKYKKKIGVVFQKIQFPEHSTVNELVSLWKSYYNESRLNEEILKQFNLEDKANDFVSNLSGGQEKLLVLALALIGNPELLVLDEPTAFLGENARDIFWKQIKKCRDQGTTILMTTHQKDDWKELQYLATKKILLVKGEILNEEILNKNNISNNKQNFDNLETNNNFSILFKQTLFEFSQLSHNPLYLFILLLIPVLLLILSFIVYSSDPNIHKAIQDAKLMLPAFCGIFVLLFYAIDNSGKSISIERIGGWIKLLRVSPLPPLYYFISKVILFLFISIIALLFITIFGIFKFEIYDSQLAWLTMLSTLVLGVIPFLLLSFAIGYLFNPKNVNVILGILLVLALSTSFDIQVLPKQIGNILAFSPFYHYNQLVMWSAHLKFYDGYFLLHIMWLIWATLLFTFIAIWAYKKDKFV